VNNQAPLPFYLFFAKLAALTEAVRVKRGNTLSALAIAAIFLVLAGIYVRPSLPFFPEHLVGGSRFYEELVNQPWGSKTWLSHRFLVPLMSNALGLTGSSMTYFNLMIVYIIITLVLRSYMTRHSDSLIPLAATSAIAFTMPVLYSIYDLWTLDGARVLFVMLMFLARGKPWLFWTLFCISLFNHEGNVLMLPFFLILQWVEHENKKRVILASILGVVLSLAIYMPIHDLTGAGSGVHYSLQRWLEGPFDNTKAGIWSLYVATFASFKLLWLVIIFGIYVLWRDREYQRALLIFSAPASAMLYLEFSGPEVFRYMMVAFPALLLAIDAIAERYEHKLVGQILLHIMLLNFIVPQQLVWGNQIGQMQSIFHLLIFWIGGP
jgi:hypothetical protein